MKRLMHWEELPDAVREAVEAQIGRVLKGEPVSEPKAGIATRLHLADGRSAFLKAIQAHSLLAERHRVEARAIGTMPNEVPAPGLLWHGRVGSWLVTVVDWIDDARPVNLAPDSPDIPAVVDLVNRLGRLLTPAPPDAPQIDYNLADLQATAVRMLDRSPVRLPHRDLLADSVEHLDDGQLRGDTLLHYDLRPCTVLVAALGQPKVVGWAASCRSAAWVEAAMLAPHLIHAGHTPQQTDELLSSVPTWRAAPRQALAGLTALWTLRGIYWAHNGPEAEREWRREAAEVGLDWLRYRTGR